MKVYCKLPSHSYLCKYAIRIEEILAKKEENLNLFIAFTMLPPNLSECQMPVFSWVALGVRLHGSFHMILS